MLLLLWHLHYISHLISQSEITSSIYLSHQNYLTHLNVSPYFQAFLMSCLSTGTNTPIPSENFSAKFDHFSQRGNTFFWLWKSFLTFLINSERAMHQCWLFSPSPWKGSNLENDQDTKLIADNCSDISPSAARSTSSPCRTSGGPASSPRSAGRWLSSPPSPTFSSPSKTPNSYLGHWDW